MNVPYYPEVAAVGSRLIIRCGYCGKVCRATGFLAGIHLCWGSTERAELDRARQQVTNPAAQQPFNPLDLSGQSLGVGHLDPADVWGASSGGGGSVRVLPAGRGRDGYLGDPDSDAARPDMSLEKDVKFKNLKWVTEELDCGNQLRMTVGILREGKPILRNAVMTPGFFVIEPSVWSEPEKVYVTSLDQVPLRKHEDYFDDDDYDRDTDLQTLTIWKDEAGFFYEKPRQVLKPAVTRKLTEDEINERLHSGLDPWLEAVYEAGRVLEENKE